MQVYNNDDFHNIASMSDINTNAYKYKKKNIYIHSRLPLACMNVGCLYVTSVRCHLTPDTWLVSNGPPGLAPLQHFPAGDIMESCPVEWPMI